ncbi:MULTISPECIES: OmpA family protein [Mesonia]|uniref:Chemotaxis protein MotB n=1 Tax=Mesonia algae TaxID=213248 RepID=A0A2W7IKM7_9FLAO|nr:MULTISPECIES: OmpA family protein [Mesonia]PZW39093.1 chemotaxis protein MotB [Mesonia algae]TXK73097.1 OmpA family protein [Mesonia sp. K4-1]
MKRIFLFTASAVLLFSSCVSSKKYKELEAKQQDTQDLLNTATVKLNTCLEEKENRVSSLQEQINLLKNTNSALLNSQGDLSTLSKKGAENLERSLESIKEKDLQIKTMRDAINKKDSVTLALVTSLKGALGNINDEDIEINVEKGVVFVSISDKLLFRSGSYQVSNRAKEVLGKVAKVVKDKKDFEFMVEGHTDTDPINNSCIIDNWDLSTKRATAVVRILQNDFNVDPSRMTAAGRSEYVPVDSNSSRDGKAANRRTRIVVLPKLDQFYGMIEEGMKKAK